MVLLKSFLKTVRRTEFAAHLSGQKVLVAVSGGADSLCLMHLLHRSAEQLNITLHVATLDHGLRGEAGAADAEFVVDAARSVGLTATHGQRDVSAIAAAQGIGIEEAARLARYTFLADVSRDFNARTIAIGHNADDQAETILMHLIRGTGLGGLRGMRFVTPLSQQHLLPGHPDPQGLHLIRPLLEISRTDIDAYCVAHGLEPRQDATNLQTTYLRNQLRHEVLPLLETLNPQIRQVLARTGTILSDEFELIEQVIYDEWRISLHTDPGGVAIDLARFRHPDLSNAVRRGVLRKALIAALPTQRDIGFTTIESALKIALEGPTSSEATLPGGVILRVSYDTLVFIAPGIEMSENSTFPQMEPGSVVEVCVPGHTPLPGSGWSLEAQWLEHAEDAANYYQRPLTAVLAVEHDARLHLRTRQVGDRFAPLGLNGRTQKLSHLLTNAKVKMAARDRIPLLTVNGEIGWFTIKGVSRVSETFAARPGLRALLLRWVKPSFQ